MSLEHVRRTMEAYLEALSARGDYGRFFADDISFDVLWSDTSGQGPREVEQTIRSVHEVAFDARSEVLRLVVGEDAAAAELSFAGRHIGEFQGIPPTGRTVRVAYSAFYEVAGGRITALRVYLPVERLIAQLRADETGLRRPTPETHGDDMPAWAAEEDYGDWVPNERDGGEVHEDEDLEGVVEAPGRSATMGRPVPAPRPTSPAGGAATDGAGSLRRILRAVVQRGRRAAASSSRHTSR